MGPEEYVASIGDRKMREKVKEQQARLLHDKKIQKNMGLLSQSIDVAGKIGGRFMPGAKLLSTVASGGVKLSASAMKDSQGGIEGLHSAPQVGELVTQMLGEVFADRVNAVHNHYVLMNDAPSQQQEQQQEQQQQQEVEYEVEEQEPEEPVDQGFYALQVEYQEQVEYYQAEEGQRQLMGEAESVHT